MKNILVVLLMSWSLLAVGQPANDHLRLELELKLDLIKMSDLHLQDIDDLLKLANKAETPATKAACVEILAATEKLAAESKDEESIRRTQVQKVLAFTRGFDKTKPVDLMKIIDPKADASGGTWKLDRSLSFSKGKDGHAFLVIPFIPPEEYELSMTVERKAGEETLDIGVIAGGRNITVLVDQDLTSGFGLTDGGSKGPDINGFGVPTRGIIKRGQPTDLTIVVSKSEIRLVAKSRTIATLESKDFDKMSPWGGFRRLLRNPRLPYIASEASFSITRLMLTPTVTKDK